MQCACRLSGVLLALVCCLPGGLSSVRRARACAPVPLPGQQIVMGDEDVVIVWDAEARRQHFIRRAQFDTSASEFAFLVPTPSVPTLTETSDSVFEVLAEAILPREEVERPWQFGTCLSFTLGATRGPSGILVASVQTGVEVLGSQVVGGLDATILRVTDSSALPAWLEENGYPQPPEVLAWVQPYVEADYILTAFKFHATEGDSRVETSAVRMSFDADAPFYPYREPQLDDEHPSGGSMRIYFLAPERASARVGDAPWSADVSYAAKISESVAENVARLVENTELTRDYWLTVFHDSTVERPDHDVIFTVAPGQEQVPAPIRVVGDPIFSPIPVELIVPVGIVWLIWRRRKKNRAPRAG